MDKDLASAFGRLTDGEKLMGEEGPERAPENEWVSTGLCARAQADGVPCTEAGRPCDECGRAVEARRRRPSSTSR